MVVGSKSRAMRSCRGQKSYRGWSSLPASAGVREEEIWLAQDPYAFYL